VKLRLNFLLGFRDTLEKLERLADIPKTIDEAYERLLMRMGDADRKLAFKIFSWILYARRSLSVGELREALSIRRGQTELNVNAMLTVADIVASCQGMVIVDDSRFIETVRFTHQTVQKFLTRTSHFDNLLPAAEIASTCVTYLSLPDLDVYCGYSGVEVDRAQFNERWWQLSSTHQFIWYAAEYWADHCKDISEMDPGILRMSVFSLLASESKRASILAWRRRFDLQPALFWFKGRCTFTPLHLLAMLGLAKICSTVLVAKLDRQTVYVRLLFLV